MSENIILPVTNACNTHKEDPNIVNLSKLTGQSRFEYFENHEQSVKNFKQEVKENVQLHYKDVSKVIDGKESKTHVGDREIEHIGTSTVTHNGDCTNVQNGDKIVILNGKNHETHFGNYTRVAEGDTCSFLKGNYYFEAKKVMTKVETALETTVEQLQTEILKDELTEVKGNRLDSVQGNSTSLVQGDREETTEKDSKESVLGTKSTVFENFAQKVVNDSVVEIGENARTEVKGDASYLYLKNKMEVVRGGNEITTGNNFQTVNGVDKKFVRYDESCKVLGNKTVNVEGTIVEHSNKDLLLSSEQTVTLNGQEKKLIGGFTMIDTLVLTSPNGVKWGIVVDDQGNLKTAVLSTS